MFSERPGMGQTKKDAMAKKTKEYVLEIRMHIEINCQ